MSENGNNGNNGTNGNVSAVPPYILAALLGSSTSGDLGPDEVLDVTVLHDEDCPLLVSGGPCTCSPKLEFRRLKVRANQ